MNRVGEALCAALREDTTRLPPLSEDDWRAVAALATQQRVGPLLLSRTHLPFPDDVRAQLVARAQVSARRALLLQAAVRELADAASARNLTIVVLKGLHLATSVYPSAGLREMGDIDVLVPAEQLEAVSEVARSLGYTTAPMRGVAHHHLPPMVRGRVNLEIHWQLFNDELGRVAAPAGLIARSVPSGLAPTARSLSPEDLLLHICVHAAGHHVLEWGMRPLCDVQAIVHRDGDTLDWNIVGQRAREWNVERSVALVLVLARDYLGVRVPTAVEAQLSAAMPPPALLTDAVDFLFEHAEHLTGTSESATRLLEIRGVTARLRHVAEVLWRPRARPHTDAQPDDGHLKRVTSAAGRAVGLSWRHGGWLWRAARDPDSPLHDALDRRNALAAWIRGR